MASTKIDASAVAEPQSDLHHASTGYSFPFLDGVRGLAILGVLSAHTPLVAPTAVPFRIVHALQYTGTRGVVLFFVLSGFLISLAVLRIRDGTGMKQYLLRRAGKILPPFYLVLLLNALLLEAGKGGVDIWPAVLAYATTYAHFTPRYAWFNPVCWTLFIEIHFYLVLPLVYLALQRVTRFAGLITGLLFLVVPVAVRFGTHYPVDNNFNAEVCRWNLFPRGFDLFAPGILLALLFEAQRGNAALRRWAVPLAWAGLGVLVGGVILDARLRFRIRHYDANSIGAYPWLSFYSPYLVAAGTFLLLMFVFNPGTPLVRALTFPPLRYAGLISYELYLVHVPVITAFGDLLPDSRHNVGLVLAHSLVPDLLSIGLAALIYHGFSAPILEQVKRYAKRSQPAR
jgi:peptidoglycan/LPS O-acetylase OafA/YrhL